jgi:hypothetical protein
MAFLALSIAFFSAYMAEVTAYIAKTIAPINAA